MKRFLRSIRWAVMVPVLWGMRMLARCLPVSVLRGVGGLVGRMAYVVLRRDRARALENLGHVFPDKTTSERAAIARASFQHFATELMSLLASGAKRTLAMRTRLLNPEALDTLIALCQPAAGERGRIYVTAHLGNWEILGGLVSLQEGRFQTFARRMKTPALERFISGIRAGNGMQVLYTDTPPASLLRTLREGTSLSILPDQDITDVEGFFVPFFGRLAWTPSAPARLAVASGCEIRTVFLVREKAGLRLLLGEPILPPERCADKTEAMVRLTQRWTSELEDAIMRYPGQWCWMHPRWRNTPERILRRRGKSPLVVMEDGSWHLFEKSGAPHE